jgi:hypothetical protein
VRAQACSTAACCGRSRDRGRPRGRAVPSSPLALCLLWGLGGTWIECLVAGRGRFTPQELPAQPRPPILLVPVANPRGVHGPEVQTIWPVEAGAVPWRTSRGPPDPAAHQIASETLPPSEKKTAPESARWRCASSLEWRGPPRGTVAACRSPRQRTEGYRRDRSNPLVRSHRAWRWPCRRDWGAVALSAPCAPVEVRSFVAW